MAGSVARGRTYPRTWTGGRGVDPGCRLIFEPNAAAANGESAGRYHLTDLAGTRPACTCLHAGVIVRHQLADPRDQFLAILDSVRLGIVASDQKAGGTQLVIFEHPFRDHPRRAHPGGRGPFSAR